MKHRHRVSCLAVLFLGGCVIRFGPIDDTGAGGDGASSSTSGTPDAELARQAEVDKYISEVVYQGGTVTQSVQLPSGDIVDGIDRATLPALEDVIPVTPWDPSALQLPPGIELGLADFDVYPEIAELVATTTPFVRPDFSPYIRGETDATSIEDYIDRYMVGGVPSDAKRLYAGVISKEPNKGVFGYLNQYRPEVQAGSFSLLEFAVTCPAKPAPLQELIGVAIKASRRIVGGKIVGDGVPRLHVEYGRMINGQYKSEWDGQGGQFKAYPLRRHRPGDAVEVSVLQGKQVEHVIGILQSLATGNWWIFYNGDALGYYPASMFTMLNSSACNASWYGEIYNDKPKEIEWLKTDMGSGLFGHLAANGTAYVRSPLYVAMNYWYGPELTENNTVQMGPQIDACYTRSKMENNIVYFGGPGGKNPSCIWPKP